jgi:hypothetical protein
VPGEMEQCDERSPSARQPGGTVEMRGVDYVSGNTVSDGRDGGAVDHQPAQRIPEHSITVQEFAATMAGNSHRKRATTLTGTVANLTGGVIVD